MFDELMVGCALVLVIEGILPFLCPECWRSAMMRALSMNAKQIRVLGLVSMACGAILLTIVKQIVD